MTHSPIPNPRPQVPFVGLAGKLTEESLLLLQQLISSINGQKDENDFLYTIILDIRITVGTGSPENVVTGSPPDLYGNLSGGAGTSWYIKESGAATNTGWIGI